MISIIIPVYNAEKYIERCLLSIIDSTYKNFEVIIVDDGSNDNTNSIIQRYILKDKRIKLICKENGGSASARNIGLNNSKGEYIAFIDSDDFVHKDYLKILYETAEKNETDIVECDFYTTTKGGIYEDIDIEPYDIEVLIINNITKLDELCEKKTYLKSCVLWNKLYKRKLFENIEFIENKGIDDEFVIHQIIFNAKKIAIVNKKLYYYFLSENSQMRSRPSLKKLDSIEAIEKQMLFFQKNDLNLLKEKLYYRYYIRNN